MDHCDPDLRHDRVFRGAEKAFNLEILLDPFEKQLDLPSLLVNFRNGGCRQSEVIGDETICFRWGRNVPGISGHGHIRATSFPVIANEVFDGHFLNTPTNEQ